MSEWESLRTYRGLGFTIRPISSWPGPMNRGNRNDKFRVGLPQTLKLLAGELRHLAARRIVMEMALSEDDLRLDGWPRVSATTAHPGVILSFESRHGPLRYATCEFRSWEANLRAIALGLEALRAVDRYGISRRGEQYAGWKAIESGGPSAERGRQIIARLGSVRAALSATHPDHGGSAADFSDVQAAREEGG